MKRWKINNRKIDDENINNVKMNFFLFKPFIKRIMYEFIIKLYLFILKCFFFFFFFLYNKYYFFYYYNKL